MAQSSSGSTTFNPKRQIQARQHRITETIAALQLSADPAKLTLLSSKSLEEVEALQQEIASSLPVGNVAGLIFNGLTHLKGKIVPPEHARRDIVALMRGLEMIPRAIYGVVFASPAAILSTYQKMLTLAGKDVEAAFPEGLWQFYLEFSMREDTAHHTNETIGFQESMETYNLNLNEADQLVAWASSIINLYFQYSDLLKVEWQERIYLNLLNTEVERLGQSKNHLFQNARKRWIQQKPFRREQDALPTETYAQYRTRKFEAFYKPRLERLPPQNEQALKEAYQTLLEEEAPAYQKQMSILATLDPDRYRETRRPIPLWQARVVIIWQDTYHILPACAIDRAGNPLCYPLNESQDTPLSLQVNAKGQLIHPQYNEVVSDSTGALLTLKEQIPVGRLQPLPIHQLRGWIGAIISGQYTSNLPITHFDTILLKKSRSEQTRVRQKLSQGDLVNLELLKMAPVIINWDVHNQNEPLAQARLGRRGVGDHTLTLFRTQNSIIFDQSHVFFDGVWGLAVSEILTSEATSWAAYLAQLPPLAVHQQIAKPHKVNAIVVTPEASGRSNKVDLKMMRELRKNLTQRDPNIVFTINDLLVLYRTLFNPHYTPSPEIEAKMERLTQSHPKRAKAIREGWAELRTTNPVLLIPIDATDVSPKDRLYPVTFWNPIDDLYTVFEKTYRALETHRQDRTSVSWVTFNQLRTELINKIHHFGSLMQAHKKTTLEGQNQSLASIKLLGHLPPAVQKMLEQLPQKFDALNELLKGEEVFSNVGQVAEGTSLMRFMSARDDNDAKTMVWGILTDDKNTMHISLRDFRPEVNALFAINQDELAQMLAQDFLDGYVSNLNKFVKQLTQIAAAVVEEIV